MAKTASFRKIDYRIRPAKNIERKMLAESFWRLAEFGRLDQYRYVGFGSLYFNDFILMHKMFGMRNLVSIEALKEYQTRFEENLPFDCISLQFGVSTEILPDLPWDVRSIVWLDYDGYISKTVLDDIRLLAIRAKTGSVIIVSVNASAGNEGERLETLIKRVGERKIPNGTEEGDLREWGTANVYRKIIQDEVLDALHERNGGVPEGARMLYRQLFNFRYADGAKMLTVGGILHDEGQVDIVAKCGFESLPFIRSNEDEFTIEAPNLTYREVRHLASKMPLSDLGLIETRGIPDADVKAYSRVYRYFPQFSEHEIVG